MTTQMNRTQFRNEMSSAIESVANGDIIEIFGTTMAFTDSVYVIDEEKYSLLNKVLENPVLADIVNQYIDTEDFPARFLKPMTIVRPLEENE